MTALEGIQMLLELGDGRPRQYPAQARPIAEELLIAGHIQMFDMEPGPGASRAHDLGFVAESTALGRWHVAELLGLPLSAPV